MAIQKQRWWPDTCGCAFEQTHDPQNPDYGVKFASTLKKCAVHQSVADDELYDLVLDGENRVKNRVHTHFVHNVPNTSQPNAPGETGLVLKTGIEYLWRFEGEGSNRVLHVSLKGFDLSAQHRKDAQNTFDQQWGAGKVVIE